MMKRRISGLVLGMWMFALMGGLPNAMAAAPGSIVINEVAWAGSADSANDEWIELYNTTGSAVDLTGWVIEDDGSTTYALSGTIAAGSYFLIEDSETSVNPNAADVVVGISLANSGDSLVLKDETGAVIDSVNSGGGLWPAGDSGTNGSMERIDVMASGDDAGNWGTSDGNGSNATASGGTLIVGTPGLLNSVGVPPITTASVMMNVSNGSPNVGDTIDVVVDVTNVTDLFSYGFDIAYDPAILSLSTVAQGTFLSESGSVTTSFQSGLEDGTAGMLIVAEARTVDPKVGLSGSGNLFTLTFDVVGGAGQSTDVSFVAGSFLADPSGDVSASMVDAQVTPQSGSVDSVTNVTVVEAASRYSMQLSWNPVVGADVYRVYRKDAHGNFVMLGETASALFVDADGVTNGGYIVPFVTYEYQVTVVSGGNESVPALASGLESRGLTGDNDRSDRVDGRDLDTLARHFGETEGDGGFDPLADTTYDAMIDGSDLIDLGANFALTYQP